MNIGKRREFFEDLKIEFINRNFENFEKMNTQLKRAQLLFVKGYLWYRKRKAYNEPNTTQWKVHLRCLNINDQFKDN